MRRAYPLMVSLIFISALVILAAADPITTQGTDGQRNTQVPTLLADQPRNCTFVSSVPGSFHDAENWSCTGPGGAPRPPDTIIAHGSTIQIKDDATVARIIGKVTFRCSVGSSKLVTQAIDAEITLDSLRLAPPCVLMLMSTPTNAPSYPNVYQGTLQDVSPTNNTWSITVPKPAPQDLLTSTIFIGQNGFNVSTRLISYAPTRGPGILQVADGGSIHYSFEDAGWSTTRVSLGSLSIGSLSTVSLVSSYPVDTDTITLGGVLRVGTKTAIKELRGLTREALVIQAEDRATTTIGDFYGILSAETSIDASITINKIPLDPQQPKTTAASLRISPTLTPSGLPGSVTLYLPDSIDHDFIAFQSALPVGNTLIAKFPTTKATITSQVTLRNFDTVQFMGATVVGRSHNQSNPFLESLTLIAKTITIENLGFVDMAYCSKLIVQRPNSSSSPSTEPSVIYVNSALQVQRQAITCVESPGIFIDANLVIGKNAYFHANQFITTVGNTVNSSTRASVSIREFHFTGTFYATDSITRVGVLYINSPFTLPPSTPRPSPQDLDTTLATESATHYYFVDSVVDLSRQKHPRLPPSPYIPIGMGGSLVFDSPKVRSQFIIDSYLHGPVKLKGLSNIVFGHTLNSSVTIVTLSNAITIDATNASLKDLKGYSIMQDQSSNITITNTPLKVHERGQIGPEDDDDDSTLLAQFNIDMKKGQREGDDHPGTDNTSGYTNGIVNVDPVHDDIAFPRSMKITGQCSFLSLGNIYLLINTKMQLSCSGESRFASEGMLDMGYCSCLTLDAPPRDGLRNVRYTFSRHINGYTEDGCFPVFNTTQGVVGLDIGGYTDLLLTLPSPTSSSLTTTAVSRLTIRDSATVFFQGLLSLGTFITERSPLRVSRDSVVFIHNLVMVPGTLALDLDSNTVTTVLFSRPVINLDPEIAANIALHIKGLQLDTKLIIGSVLSHIYLSGAGSLKIPTVVGTPDRIVGGIDSVAWEIEVTKGQAVTLTAPAYTIVNAKLHVYEGGYLNLYGDFTIAGPIRIDQGGTIAATKLSLTYKVPFSSLIFGTITVSELLALEGSAVNVAWDSAVFNGEGLLLCSTQPEYAGSMANAKNFYEDECCDKPIYRCSYDEEVTIVFVNTPVPHKAPQRCKNVRQGAPLKYRLEVAPPTPTLALPLNSSTSTVTATKVSRLSPHNSEPILPPGVTWNDTLGHFQGIPTAGFPPTTYDVTPINRAGDGQPFHLSLGIATYHCPAGYYCRLDPAVQPPAVCPEGAWCPADTQQPWRCSRGDYCPRGSSTKTLCPAGHWCPNAITVHKCNPGMYCPPGSDYWSICPDGYWCTEDAKNITKCVVPQVCPSNSTQPTWCPGGYFCPSPLQMHKCDRGFYCPGNSTEQIECTELGTYCPSGVSLPWPCREGSYCPTTKSVVSCPQDYKCPIRSFEPTPCERGDYCANQGTGGNAACKPSRYCPTPRESILCPSGHYCPPSTSEPHPCDEEGSEMAYYCPEGTSNRTLCDAGHQCPNSERRDRCQIPGDWCPEGSKLSRPCPAGYYCVEPSTSAICPTFHYCPVASTAPKPCTEDGYVCPEGSSQKTPCERGTAARRNELNCTKCLPGWAAPEEHSGSCSICAAGKFSEGYGSYECLACGEGYTTAHPGSTSAKDCVLSSTQQPFFDQVIARLLIAIPSIATSIALFVFGVWANRKREDNSWQHFPGFYIANEIRKQLRLSVSTVEDARNQHYLSCIAHLVIAVISHRYPDAILYSPILTMRMTATDKTQGEGGSERKQQREHQEGEEEGKKTSSSLSTTSRTRDSVKQDRAHSLPSSPTSTTLLEPQLNNISYYPSTNSSHLGHNRRPRPTGTNNEYNKDPLPRQGLSTGPMSPSQSHLPSGVSSSSSIYFSKERKPLPLSPARLADLSADVLEMEMYTIVENLDPLTQQEIAEIIVMAIQSQSQFPVAPCLAEEADESKIQFMRAQLLSGAIPNPCGFTYLVRYRFDPIQFRRSLLRFINTTCDIDVSTLPCHNLGNDSNTTDIDANGETTNHRYDNGSNTDNSNNRKGSTLNVNHQYTNDLSRSYSANNDIYLSLNNDDDTHKHAIAYPISSTSSSSSASASTSSALPNDLFKSQELELSRSFKGNSLDSHQSLMDMAHSK